MATETDTISLIMNGAVPMPTLLCPALDPNAAIQIGDDLIAIYQSRIDGLIDQLGKHVLINFDPIQEICPNCLFDTMGGRSIGIYKVGGPTPFSRGQKCPYCKGHGFLITERQKCIKALIKWNPKDAATYGVSVRKHRDIVRFKTFASELDDLIRARFAISNSAISDMIKLKVKLIKSPILVGLRESRYCISFWELVDN